MVVTISREYGAGGDAVSHDVARDLGYEWFSDQLATDVALAVGTTPGAVSERTETRPTLVERVARGLAGATPELLAGHAPLPDEFDERVRGEIERKIRERAAAGDVVILGRCGSAILGAVAGVVRVFLGADPAWRAARGARALDLPLARAHAELERVDLARKRFARDRYRFGWGDPHAYDIVLDVGRLGIARATSAIVHAVRTATP